MVQPLAICLEDFGESPRVRFLRCVALPGRGPGLGLGLSGQIVWEATEELACELCVSSDDRLILLRPPTGAEVTVRRAGRALRVPHEKPVVLVDQDQIEVGGQKLRLHVHGVAPAVHGPSPFVAPKTRTLAALAAAVALGATAGCCKNSDILDGPDSNIEVREAPPVAPIERPDAADAGADAGGSAKKPDSGSPPAH